MSTHNDSNNGYKLTVRYPVVLRLSSPAFPQTIPGVYTYMYVHTQRQLSCLASAILKTQNLTKYEVVRIEELSERPRPNGVHGTGLEVNQHATRHILSASSLVVVHVYSLQLQVGVAYRLASRIDTMFVRDNLPELRRKCKGEKTITEIMTTLGCMRETEKFISP